MCSALGPWSMNNEVTIPNTKFGFLQMQGLLHVLHSLYLNHLSYSIIQPSFPYLSP